MKRILKWTGIGIGALILLVVVVAAIQIVRFDRAMAAAVDVPEVNIVASPDSTVLARGQHVASSFGGCTACHGADLSGTPPESFGPIGVMSPPNLTSGQGGVAANYTDQQLARAIRYGVRHDGTSLMFMPTEEHIWWPDSDLQAVVSYVRSVPPVDVQREPSGTGALGKILTGFGIMDFRSAIAVQKLDVGTPPDPEPTARYGQFLALGCRGCHGEHFSGGPIPGAPADLPVPTNITPHETGVGNWTFDDFKRLLATGTRPDGTRIDPFMPIENLNRMSELEKTALWEYLQSLEPRPYGE